VQSLPEVDFADLALRLASYGLRLFAEFGLGGPGTTVPGVGSSVEDFVWRVLAQFAQGSLVYDPSKGALFSLLAKALRNDVIDALRKAAHQREESRSTVPRDEREGQARPALDELPSAGTSLDDLLGGAGYRDRLLAALDGEPELAAVVTAVLDLDLSTPREIAEELHISVAEYQNRKKRLRRRLIEYHAVYARQR
jgi:DNA-directed RNA polymerase specialized sigma24 family protein